LTFIINSRKNKDIVIVHKNSYSWCLKIVMVRADK